ncbi:hypothetical protein D3C80_1425840 [compost metagenome]
MTINDDSVVGFTFNQQVKHELAFIRLQQCELVVVLVARQGGQRLVTVVLQDEVVFVVTHDFVVGWVFDDKVAEVRAAVDHVAELEEACVLTFKASIVTALLKKLIILVLAAMDITNGVVFAVRFSHDDVLLQKIRDRVVFHWTISQS